MAVRIQPYSGLSGGSCPDGQSVVLMMPARSYAGLWPFRFSACPNRPEETIAFRTHDGYGDLRLSIGEDFTFFAPGANKVSVETVRHLNRLLC